MTDKFQTREERRKKLKESKKKKKKPKKGLFKKILFTLIGLFIVGLLIGIGTFAYYVSSTPELDESLLKDPISSKIYAMNGELITEVGTEKRDYVTFDEIPQKVIDAVLATEDSRFYEHKGVDVLRLGSAVIANFTDGFGSQGASTITQQLVKRSFLTDEKTLKRKAQELWLSLQIERKYSKEEIFEMYINKIFYGAGANGIAKAAETYFGKTLDDLTLVEAATLAGLPQSPTNYNPFNYPERAEERRNTVLSLMNKHGYISESEMNEAKQIPIEDYLLPEDKRGGEDMTAYDSFIDAVLDEVEEKTDYNPYADGLEIYTTLDPDAQEYVYNALNTNDVVNFPSDKLQTGITLLDTKTGQIRAIGGGRKQTVSRGYNYATELRRQPGSTIKPILDYGPAIEHLKWSTYEQIVDEPYQYSSGESISNWNNRHQGQMSIRTALAKSLNIPALKAMQAVGLEKSRAFGESLGLKFDEFYESASIGGTSNMSPTILAGAYSAFGNEGIYNEPYTVTKIVLADGETTIDLQPESKVVMQDYTAFMITDMLKTVVTSGTGTEANISGLPVAGKTGTTNFTAEERAALGISKGENAVPDAWFVGYTTNYTMAIWTGYDSKKEDYLGSESQKIPKKLFKNIMSHVSEKVKTKDFSKPSSVVKVGVEKGSNPAKLPSANTPADQITYEYFVKGTTPTTVSEAYDKLDAPAGLNATYSEESNEIILTWSYPTNEETNPTFNVTVSVDGAGQQTLAQSGDFEARVSNPTPGSIYKFNVTATVGSQTSDPASVTFQVPDLAEEEEEIIEEEIEDIPEVEEEEPSDNNPTTPPSNSDEPETDDSNNNTNNTENNNNGNNNNGNTPDNGPIPETTNGSTQQSTVLQQIWFTHFTNNPFSWLLK